MRVEIIEEKYSSELQNKINKFLSRCDPSDVIDIKYSGGGAIAAYSTRYFSAMIILK